MRIRCAVLDDYQGVALKMADWNIISDCVEIDVFSTPFQTEDAVVKAIENYEIIVIMRERTPFPSSLIARLPNLKLLVTSGMRNSSIDIAAAKLQGIQVCGTASLSEPPVELTWALLLNLARNVTYENTQLRENGSWQSTIGDDLNGKCLGLFGLGKLGSRMAKIAQAFGMEVIAWSQNLTREQTALLGVELATSKEELLEKSDYVSIHLVLSERTRGFIKKKDLQLMKSTAYLINTSRAAIVDQDSLVEALQQGWIAGAGLDVFEEEPLQANHPFRSLSNVLATPHIGYVSKENYKIYYREAVEDINAFLKGKPIRQLG